MRSWHDATKGYRLMSDCQHMILQVISAREGFCIECGERIVCDGKCARYECICPVTDDNED